MTTLLGVALAVYTVLLFALAAFARGRVHDADDYLVAGRRLGLGLSTATLFATWFGAGTLLVAADEVRAEGVRAAALDPLGAGLCLLIAATFAPRLWRMKLLTLGDFFRVRFGPRAEALASALMVPGYFGWIAAQFVALAGMLELFFGIDPTLGVTLVMVVGAGYTLVGGMWSVTLTDAVQVGLILVGLGILAFEALAALGGADPGAGLSRLIHETPSDLLEPIPHDALAPFLAWLGVLCAGALGNLPGQDLLQRVFAARSETVARRACVLSGVAYLAVGIVPVGLGLAARLLAPDGERATLPLLADLLLSPALGVVFVLMLSSVVLSTIDSAILAPASVIAQNLMPKLGLGHISTLRRTELAVIGVALASFELARRGEDAYGLLESAYEIGLVSLLVPLLVGLWSQRGGERAAITGMLTGTGVWLAHWIPGWDWLGGPFVEALGLTVPVGLASAALALVAYAIASARRA